MRGNSHSGFTLIEISIVLVIIGLIVGGVLVGQDLIHAAEIRKMVSQTQQFQTAINTFRIKYGALPGDMSNATLYWSDAINGDGNGEIEKYNSGGITFPEGYNAWNHLADAQLVNGYFAPVPIAALSNAQLMTVSPPGAIQGTFFHIAYDAPETNPQSANYISITRSGINDPATPTDFLNLENFTSFSVGLSPSDAAEIDVKMDDGLPLSGKAVAPYFTHGNPSNMDCSDASGSNIYNLTTAKFLCGLWIKVD